ncbi:MAG: MerR family transcriptional regulator [Myxococcales bacterium]|nr:MerR family transcriptional regulator [Myxococcales bacterium]
MLIHELSEQTGFSIDTIRYYEKLGIVARPTRRRNGYRDYHASTVACLRLCKRAKDLGFSLDEIRELGKLLDAKQLSSERMRERLHRKLAEIETKLTELTKLRDDVRDALASKALFTV